MMIARFRKMSLEKEKHVKLKHQSRLTVFLCARAKDSWQLCKLPIVWNFIEIAD
jgi:hypothetical protein